MSYIREQNRWESLILLQKTTSELSLYKHKRSTQNSLKFFDYVEIIRNIKQGIHK